MLAFLAFLLGVQPDPLLSEAQIQSWVRDFAPIVIHDSREKAPLTSIEAQLALNPTLQGSCADQSRRSLQISSLDFMQQAEVQDLIQNCHQELAIHFERQIPAAKALSYYSVISDGLYLKIQYWLYYAWNDAGLLGGGGAVQQCGQHEGDWEHIALRINRQKLLAAQSPEQQRQAIDDIYLSQHHRNQHPERKYLRPSDPRLQFEGSHLRIYPGAGSHASYPAAGQYPLMTLATMQVSDVNDGKGLRLDLAQGILEPIVKQPWFGFPGRWGAVVHDSCDAIEAVSSASNDGSFGPGHDHKLEDLYKGDWQHVVRPHL